MKVKYESDFDPVNSTPFQNGVEDVKNHKWFDGVDWILLTDRAISVIGD